LLGLAGYRALELHIAIWEALDRSEILATWVPSYASNFIALIASRVVSGAAGNIPDFCAFPPICG